MRIDRSQTHEEVETLRADKERLDYIGNGPCGIYVERNDKRELQWVVCDFNANDLGAGQTPREAIDQALQTNGRVPESTPEAKQEASPARKEKADA